MSDDDNNGGDQKPPKSVSITITWDEESAGPLPHDPGWIEALATAAPADLAGLDGWVTSCDGTLLDATASVAAAMGEELEHMLGKPAMQSGKAVVNTTTQEEMIARRHQVCKEGGWLTAVDVVKLADRGWSTVMHSMGRVINRRTGVPYVIHIAHDITDAAERWAFLRAPGFQNAIHLLIGADGVCITATEAAARMCGAPSSDAMVGMTLDNTPYKKLADQERAQVQQSRANGEPANSVEWLAMADGSIGIFTVSRISYPDGRWTVHMIPIPLSPPFFQLQVGEMLHGANMTIPQSEHTVTARQFEALLDLANGLSAKQAAAYRRCGVDNINKHRSKLKKLCQVKKPKQIIGALQGSPLGLLVAMMAMRERGLMDDMELPDEA